MIGNVVNFETFCWWVSSWNLAHCCFLSDERKERKAARSSSKGAQPETAGGCKETKCWEIGMFSLKNYNWRDVEKRHMKAFKMVSIFFLHFEIVTAWRSGGERLETETVGRRTREKQEVKPSFVRKE